MAEKSGATRMSMNEMAKKITRGHKAGGIIVAICMIVLGILFLCWPLRTDYVVMVIASIGFVIYGVYQIIVYIRTPREYKNGWVLANGIVYAILGCLLLTEGAASMFVTFAFLLGFLAMFGGITQCASYGLIRNAGEPGAGWVLASGIINIILAIFLLMTPFAATWALGLVIGIYLIVGGVALFAEACSGHYGLKY